MLYIDRNHSLTHSNSILMEAAWASKKLNHIQRLNDEGQHYKRSIKGNKKFAFKPREQIAERKQGDECTISIFADLYFTSLFIPLSQTTTTQGAHEGWGWGRTNVHRDLEYYLLHWNKTAAECFHSLLKLQTSSRAKVADVLLNGGLRDTETYRSWLSLQNKTSTGIWAGIHNTVN